MSLQKILIVEDQRIVAKDLEVHLQKLGYEVVNSVINGKDAIESVHLHKPDLILMDILIEGDIDGIETANIILAQNPIPIIYLTAQADQETFKRATQSAPYGYILKPFQQREIEVTIETVLNRARLEKVLRTNEAELRYSNEKFEHFFANSLEGAAFRMLDKPLDWENHPDQGKAVDYALENLRVTKVNQAMLDQYKLSEQAFLGSSIADLFPNNRELVKDIIKQLFTFKKLPIEAKEQRPDGTHLWVNGNTSCFLDENGHILGIFVLQRDITQQKLSQDLIHNQSQILEKIAKDFSIDEILNDICYNIEQLIGHTYCAILCLENKNTSSGLKVLAAPNFNQFQIEELTSFDLQSPSGQRLLAGQELLIGDIEAANLTQKYKRFAKQNHWKSTWFIPVFATNQQLQSILMVNCLRSHLPSDLEKNVIKTSTSLTSLAIERNESQQRLQKQALTFENLNDALVVTDYNGNIQEWNPAATNMFGYARNEISKKNASSIFRSSNLIKSRQIVLDLLNKHGKWMGEVDFIKKDGSQGISKATVLHLKDKQNQRVGILSINRDITAQKQTEKALEVSQKNLQVIFDNTNQIFVLLDAKGGIRAYNKKAVDQFTSLWKGDIAHLRHWLDIFPKDMQKKVAYDWEKVINGTTIIDETKFDFGERRHFFSFSYIPIFDAQNQVTQVCFAATDITGRKKSEINILESRAKLEALIENTSDGIWSVDMALKVTTVNTALQKFFDTLLGEKVQPGDSFIDKLPENIRAHWQVLFEKALAGKRVNEEFELELSHTTVYFELSVNPIANTKGAFKGATAFLKDITQKKIHENALTRANSELDSFVYKASHDLRAPLRSILGLVSLTRLEPSADERSSYLDMMEKSAKKLDSFIADLTNLSRNSRLEMTIEPIDFEELITEAIEGLQFMSNASRVSISTKISQNGHMFHSNASRLGIIFQNMVSNAIKYQNLAIEDAFLKIDIQLTGNGAHIVFKDNGRGIAPEFLEQIFDMFFRATDNSYGSGLGLYITQQAIDKIKGRVEVDSEVNKGTTFTLALPNLEGETTLNN